MITLEIHGLRKSWELAVPEQWDELTGEQFMRVADVLYGKKRTKDNLQTRLLMALLGLKNWQFKFIGTENISRILDLTDFLLEQKGVTKQLLPFVEISGVKYYGPHDEITNLVNCEFHMAEAKLYSWHLRRKALCGDNEELLDNSVLWEDDEALSCMYEFVAVLYRPGKKDYDLLRDEDGDVREKYNSNLVPYYAKILRENLSAGCVKAIFLWYNSCRSYMYSIPEFKTLFDSHNTSEIEGVDAYAGMMRAIAKEGAYGDYDKVEFMYIWNTLWELKMSKDDADRMKEAMRTKAPEL